MKRTFYTLILLALLSGCTKATSTTELLAELTSFSSVSSNPFKQDQPGEYVTVSGYCLPGTTGFEFKVNNLSLWTSIPATAPAPDASQGEYIVGSPVYDVDCSDGQFNFYMFHSDVGQNFLDNSVSVEEPYKIEIRALPDTSLPTITFERPAPYTFEIRSLNHDSAKYLETGRSMKFEVTLLDVSKEDTTPVGTNVVANLLAVNLTNSGGQAGLFYDPTCTSPISTLTFSASAGEREKEFCYKAASVTPLHQILLEISATGMISKSHNLIILGQNSATIQFYPLVYSGANLPPHLVKGVEYKLALDMKPLYTDPTGATNRYVSSFNGSFSISSEADVALKADAFDTDCSNSFVYGNLNCSVATSTSKNIHIKPSLTSSQSAVTITATSTPVTNCSLEAIKCLIDESPTATSNNISDYAPFSISIPLVHGSSNYTQPYFKPSRSHWEHDETIEVAECREGFIGTGNAEGHLLPTPSSSVTMNIGTQDGNVSFYASQTDCQSNISPTTSQSIVLNLDSLGAPFYYKVHSIPAHNQVKFIVQEGGASFNYDFYLRGTIPL